MNNIHNRLSLKVAEVLKTACHKYYQFDYQRKPFFLDAEHLCIQLLTSLSWLPPTIDKFSVNAAAITFASYCCKYYF